jgi:repressor LexA
VFDFGISVVIRWKLLYNTMLTIKQTALLDFIRNYISHNGYPPALKEMATFLGIRSLSTVHQHLMAIKKKGLIDQVSARSRNVAIPNIPKLIKLPLLGEIAAGLPIEPLEDPEPVYVSTALVKSPTGHYALRVRGNSMIDDNIQDGDIVIIRAQDHISHMGQTIVAIINGGATLKRYGGVNGDGMIKLVPRNPEVKTMLVHYADFEVRGSLVGLIRTV